MYALQFLWLFPKFVDDSNLFMLRQNFDVIQILWKMDCEPNIETYTNM